MVQVSHPVVVEDSIAGYEESVTPVNSQTRCVPLY